MKTLILHVIWFVSSLSWAGSGITYHGRILKSDNTPVTSPTTEFRIQIKSPGDEGCLMWEEFQTKDLSQTAGVFSITIGDIDATNRTQVNINNPLTSSPFTLLQVFSNKNAFPSGLTCDDASGTYTPATNHGRTFQVYFRETNVAAWEEMPPATINYVPLAYNSTQLDGYRSNEFLKIDPLAVYTPLTAGQVNTLVDIIAGTNTQYLRPSTTFGGDVSGTYNAISVNRIRGTNVVATAPTSGQVLKYDGTNWVPSTDDTGGATGDASYAAKGVVQINTDQATSGLYIASGVLALPNVITAGGPTGGASTVPVITYDQKGRLTAVSTATVDDTTKLPLAGGTMTGSIDMGSQNITNATSVAATNFSGRNLVLNDNDTNTVTVRTPSDITANYVLELPANDGGSGEVLTTNGSGILSWTAPASGISVTANQAVIADGVGTGLTNFTCPINQAFSFDGAGLPTCLAVTPAGGFINGGNSFGAAATLGTNDNFALNFETNGTTKMTVLANGNVGIGTTNPGSPLHVVTSGAPYNTATLESACSGCDVNFNVYNNMAVNSSAVRINLVNNFGSGGQPYGAIRGIRTSNLEGALTLSASNAAGSLIEGLRISSLGYTGLGATNPSTILDIAGATTQRGMAAPALSPAGQGRIYFDSTSNKFSVSQNGGAYVDLIPAGGAVGGTGTTNALPKFTAAGTIGDSAIVDNGTTITTTRSIASATNPIASGASINLATSNTHTLASVGGSAITITNPSNGGVYNVVIEDTTSRTYTFSGCTTTYFKPANAATESGTRSIYGLMTVQKGGNWDCYVTWSTGFQ